jgi:hypothetical protein
MQKSQNFGCLFRHYAKHNGLDKDTLTFSFLDELQPDQIPENVHLLSGDEIFVSHKPKAVEEPQTHPGVSLIKSFDAMLKDQTFWDVTFVFPNEANAEIGAHKCVLCNRCNYFSAMFRSSLMAESINNRVEIHHCSQFSYNAMLEFIYTAKIKNLNKFDATQSIQLLNIATEYLIDDLKIICQHALGKLLSIHNITKIFCVAEEMNAEVLMGHVKVTELHVVAA